MTKNWIRFLGGFVFLIIVTMALAGFVSAPLQFDLQYQKVKANTNLYDDYLLDYSHKLNSQFASSFYLPNSSFKLPEQTPGQTDPTWKNVKIAPSKYNVGLGQTKPWSFLNEPLLNLHKPLVFLGKTAPNPTPVFMNLSLQDIIQNNIDVDYAMSKQVRSLSDYLFPSIQEALDILNEAVKHNQATYAINYEYIDANHKVKDYKYGIPLKELVNSDWWKALHASLANPSEPLYPFFQNEDSLEYKNFLNVVVHQWALQNHLDYQYHSDYIFYGHKKIANVDNYFETTGANVNNLDNVVLNSGHMPRAPNQAIITPRYAASHHLHLGDTIAPFANNFSNQAKQKFGVYNQFQIVGIGISLDTLTPNNPNFNSFYDDINNFSMVYLLNSEMIRLHHYFASLPNLKEAEYYTSYVRFQNIDENSLLNQVFNDNGTPLFDSQSNILVNYKNTNAYQTLTTMQVEVLLFLAVGLVLFLLGFLFLNFVMKQEVNQSRYQIGLFKAFGYYRSQIAAVLSLKTVILLFLATWIGYVCSIPLQQFSAGIFTRNLLFLVMPVFLNPWFLIALLLLLPLCFCLLSWGWNYWFLMRNNALKLMAPAQKIAFLNHWRFWNKSQRRFMRLPFIMRMQISYTKQGFGKYLIILLLFFGASFLFMVELNVSSLFHVLFDDITTVYNQNVANKTTFFPEEDSELVNTKPGGTQQKSHVDVPQSISLNDVADYYQSYGWWDSANPLIQNKIAAAKQYWHQQINDFIKAMQNGGSSSYQGELQHLLWTFLFLFSPHYLPSVDQLPNIPDGPITKPSSVAPQVPLITSWADFKNLINTLNLEGQTLLHNPAFQSFLNLKYGGMTVKAFFQELQQLAQQLDFYADKIVNPQNLTLSFDRFLFNSHQDAPDYELKSYLSEGLPSASTNADATAEAQLHLLNFQSTDSRVNPLGYQFNNQQSYFNFQGVSTSEINEALEPASPSQIANEPIPTIISNRLAILNHLQLNSIYHVSFDQDNINLPNNYYTFKVVGIQKTNTLANDIYLNYNNFMEKYYDSQAQDKKFPIPHADPVLQDPLFNNVYSKNQVIDGTIDLFNLPQTVRNLKYNEPYINYYAGNVQFDPQNKMPYVTWANIFNFNAAENGVNSGLNFLGSSSFWPHLDRFQSFTLEKLILKQASQRLILAFTLFQIIISCLLLILLIVIISVVLEESWNFILIFRAFGYHPRQINFIVVGNYFLSIIIVILASFGVTIAAFQWVASYLLQRYSFIILNPVAYPSLLITMAVFAFILIIGWTVAWRKISRSNLLQLKND